MDKRKKGASAINDVGGLTRLITEMVGDREMTRDVVCADRKLPDNEAVVIVVLTDKTAQAYVFERVKK